MLQYEDSFFHHLFSGEYQFPFLQSKQLVHNYHYVQNNEVLSTHHCRSYANEPYVYISAFCKYSNVLRMLQNEDSFFHHLFLGKYQFPFLQSKQLVHIYHCMQSNVRLSIHHYQSCGNQAYSYL